MHPPEIPHELTTIKKYHFVFIGKSSSSETRQKYPVDYKLRIVEETKVSTVRAVARLHGIDHSVIRRWVQQEQVLKEACSSGRLFRREGGGRRPDQIKNPDSFKIQKILK